MRLFSGRTVKPFIVADAAFALSDRVMKCYDTANPTPNQFAFNYALIRTRRVVECGFGRVKGRFRILSDSRLQNPRFAADVAMVCFGLHNILERFKCPFEPGLLPIFEPSDEQGARRDSDRALDVRDLLAEHMHAVLGVVPAHGLHRENMLHGGDALARSRLGSALARSRLGRLGATVQVVHQLPRRRAHGLASPCRVFLARSSPCDVECAT